MLLKELTIEQKNCITSEIQFNIKAEAEANEFYFNALTGRFVTSDVLSVKENNSNIRTR